MRRSWCASPIKLDLAVSINTAPTAIRVAGCVDEHSASQMFSRYLQYTPVLWVFGLLAPLGALMMLRLFLPNRSISRPCSVTWLWWMVGLNASTLRCGQRHLKMHVPGLYAVPSRFGASGRVATVRRGYRRRAALSAELADYRAGCLRTGRIPTAARRRGAAGRFPPRMSAVS